MFDTIGDTTHVPICSFSHDANAQSLKH